MLAGSPGGIAKAVGRDLPAAIFTMVATIAFTSVTLELTDAISDWVWAGTRDDAKRALDQLALLLRTGLPGLHFVAVALAVLVLVAMVFLWIVLYVREALLYLVIVFAAAFAWPMMVFPPLRDTAKKAGELLLALIICKPVIALALSVGVSAMATIGNNDQASTVAQLGTLVSGVIVFGLAAFMPFVVFKLLPVAAAAVVAQGVAVGADARRSAGHADAVLRPSADQRRQGPRQAGRRQRRRPERWWAAAARRRRRCGGRRWRGAAAAAGPAGVAVAGVSMAAKAVKNTATQTAGAATSAAG